jgi:hypothetical protein
MSSTSPLARQLYPRPLPAWSSSLLPSSVKPSNLGVALLCRRASLDRQSFTRLYSTFESDSTELRAYSQQLCEYERAHREQLKLVRRQLTTLGTQRLSPGATSPQLEDLTSLVRESDTLTQMSLFLWRSAQLEPPPRWLASLTNRSKLYAWLSEVSTPSEVTFTS